MLQQAIQLRAAMISLWIIFDQQCLCATHAVPLERRTKYADVQKSLVDDATWNVNELKRRISEMR